ncbi:odorant binding protein C19 [Tribolium castaneum]|uniref:Odorant binding protein C19 n=1 Tax=Tribolium castaneum TaxID=7070 RepID=D6X0T3_TRICA|nr:PREDICTED: uncharacterized protein LOC107398714 [Tribolium castaneum]EFA10683.1 odorant binding protein C19 [Tribolium castaneum]|eukprot:XP_015839339.1 PREDICTED: uncharacterized protein LOC107398714 [Tribolium castaneum]
MSKTVFIFVIFFYLDFYATGDESVYLSNHEACVKLSGVDETLLETIYEGDVFEDMKFKTYIHCFFKKSGFQDENGVMHFDAIKSSFHKDFSQTENIDKTITECEEKKLNGESALETAFLHFKCFMGEL